MKMHMVCVSVRMYVCIDLCVDINVFYVNIDADTCVDIDVDMLDLDLVGLHVGTVVCVSVSLFLCFSVSLFGPPTVRLTVPLVMCMICELSVYL